MLLKDESMGSKVTQRSLQSIIIALADSSLGSIQKCLTAKFFWDIIQSRDLERSLKAK